MDDLDVGCSRWSSSALGLLWPFINLTTRYPFS